MFRFFVNEKKDNYFILNEDTLKHMKVARVLKDEFICIYEGVFYKCILENNFAKIIDTIDENHEHSGEVIIAASYIDTKRFEWLIQKAAELGATKLIPMISKNISKKIPNDIDKKLIRWNQIALNASEQSFRNYPLEVARPMEFNDVCNIDINNKYIAHEKSDSKTEQSFDPNSLFLVGPEGGFTNEEVEYAGNNGVEVISLGKRILRAETASMFILSRINSV